MSVASRRLLGLTRSQGNGSYPQATIVTGTGVDATGVTECSAAINTILTAGAGGHTHIPKGTYLVSSPLSVPAGTVLTGDGEGTVIFLQASAPDSGDGTADVIHVAGNNVTVRDLTVDGNRANQVRNSNGIRVLTGVKNVKIVNNHVYRANGYGIVSYPNCEQILYAHNTVEDVRDEALELQGCGRSAIVGNTVKSAGKNGIYVWGATASTPSIVTGDVTISGNQVNSYANLSNGFSGIKVDDGMQNVTVTGNSVSGGGTGGQGIAITGTATIPSYTTGVTVTGNTVDASPADGIVIGPYVTGCTVTGNNIRTAGNRGIYGNGATVFRLQVSGNTITASVGDGIRMDSLGGQFGVVGNQVYSCNSGGAQTGGIVVTGSSNGTMSGNTSVANNGKGIAETGSSNTNTIVGNTATGNSDGTYDITYVGAATKVTNNTGRYIEQGGSSSTLATVIYNPGANTTAALTTSDANFDATNAKITFTAPASGTVILTASCLLITGATTATGQTVYFTFRTAGAAATGSRARIINTANSGAGPVQIRVRHAAKITGLTPGTSYSYTLGGWYAGGTGAASVGWGDDAGSGPLGPLVMEALAA